MQLAKTISAITQVYESKYGVTIENLTRNYKHYILYNFITNSSDVFDPDNFYEICDANNPPSSHVKAKTDIKRVLLSLPNILIESSVICINYRIGNDVALTGNGHVKGSLIALEPGLTAYIGPKTKIDKEIIGFEKVVLLADDSDIEKYIK